MTLQLETRFRLLTERDLVIMVLGSIYSRADYATTNKPTNEMGVIPLQKPSRKLFLKKK